MRSKYYYIVVELRNNFFYIIRFYLKINSNLIGNLNLSRSLGDLEYKQNKKLGPEEQMITAFPEMKVENLTPDCDFIILACDGVWDCLTNQEICDIVKDRLRKEPNIILSKIIEDILENILATDIYNGINFILFNFLILITFRNWSWM